MSCTWEKDLARERMKEREKSQQVEKEREKYKEEEYYKKWRSDEAADYQPARVSAATNKTTPSNFKRVLSGYTL